jgi:hypothetical protein
MAGVHSEHVQLIRSDIGPESVKKYRDVQNEQISGKQRGVLPMGTFLKHRNIFLKLKTAFSRHNV